jgi:acyl-coenzyme A thioesterase PaaI-like protein
MARQISARWLRWGMNLWPPFLGAGIRVRHIAPDFRDITVEMPLRFYNRNYVGTHFGGSLFAMTDPFFMLMVVRNLAHDYLVWDKAASIDFIAPGRGCVRSRFLLTDADLAQIRTRTADGDKHLHLFKVDVTDAEGLVVARVEKIVYIRRKREPRRTATEAASDPASDPASNPATNPASNPASDPAGG